VSGTYGTFSTRQEERRKRTIPDRVLIRRVYNYAQAHKRNLTIGISATIFGALTGLASPYMHAIAIDQIIAPKNLSGFLWWIPLFVSVILGNYVFQYIQTYQMRIVGENVVAKMRDDMMEKLQVISLKYFSEGEIGRIISRPTNDANMVRIFLRLGLTSILIDISSILGSFTIMFYLDGLVSWKILKGCLQEDVDHRFRINGKNAGRPVRNKGNPSLRAGARNRKEVLEKPKRKREGNN
jgi:ABC-type bacteriocin/lantibiotic exporter with double-glycine peptidase domain